MINGVTATKPCQSFHQLIGHNPCSLAGKTSIPINEYQYNHCALVNVLEKAMRIHGGAA